MDEVVKLVEGSFLEPCFNLNRGSLFSQIAALYMIILGGGSILYLASASLSYYAFFLRWKDRFHPDTQPQPFKGQVKLEIQCSMRAIPIMSNLTVPFFLAEIRGHSRLYDRVDDYGWPFLVASIVAFLLWSDAAIYFLHRWLHENKWAYRTLHKEHHKWKVPTPFAAVAFHPLDGWAQSLPYHLFPFVFPMHKWLSLGLFVFVQLWTVGIHDGVDASPAEWINGSAHHTFHHSMFNYNYGQYFVWWDKWCGTYMDPYSVYDPNTKTWRPSHFASLKEGRKEL